MYMLCHPRLVKFARRIPPTLFRNNIYFTLVILPTMVSMVLALSVLVLIVVSEAVLEPMTTTFGTVRQLRLPPADLKLNRRIADDRRSLSRPPPPSAPCCPRDGCDCDVSPVSHALFPKLPHLVADSRFLAHPCNSSDYGFARVPHSSRKSQLAGLSKVDNSPYWYKEEEFKEKLSCFSL